MFVIREVFERGRRGDAEADWREEEETRDGGNSLPGGGGVEAERLHSCDISLALDQDRGVRQYA